MCLDIIVNSYWFHEIFSFIFNLLTFSWKWIYIFFQLGCEVSAVLHHGSYIRFGCLQFVFSITNYEDDDEGDKEADFSLRSDPDLSKRIKNDDSNTPSDCENEIKNEDIEMKDD